MIDIFLSRPTWISDEFKEGLKNFYTYLNSHNLNPRTIGASDYPIESPLDEVITLMERCNGAIVLGFPQINITNGAVKNIGISEELVLPTEWNHIEAALAYAKKLPILLIHHPSIKRGVFDRGAVNTFLYEVDLADPAWPLSERISGALSSWLPKVSSYRKSTETQSSEKTQLSSRQVTIGTLNKSTLATDIRAEIELSDNSQPSVDLFLDRIRWKKPYCPTCLRPLREQRASWMADGVQIGFKCEKCSTDYEGKYDDVHGEILAEVRNNYPAYWEKYKEEINKLTGGEPQKYRLPE